MALVARYQDVPATGTLWNDASGGGKNATVSGAASTGAIRTKGPGGSVGSGVTLNGTSQWFAATSSAPSAFPFTLSVWSIRSDNDAADAAISIYGSVNQHMVLETAESRTPIHTRNTTTSRLYSAHTDVSGIWHHAAAVFQNGDADVDVYFNGAFSSTQEHPPVSMFATAKILLGIQRDYATAETGFLGGSIADARIYDEALTAGQIASIYRYGRSRRAFHRPGASLSPIIGNN